MERRNFIAEAGCLLAACILPKSKSPLSENDLLKFRQVYRFEAGHWRQIEFSELRAGDQFRLKDDCENPIERGENTYVATTNPVPCEGEGNWMVRVVPLVAYAPGSATP